MSRESVEGLPRCQQLLNRREGGWFNDNAQCSKQVIKGERLCKYHKTLRVKWFNKQGKPYTEPNLLTRVPIAVFGGG